MRILGFGTYDTRRHPRVGIVLDGFRAAGDEVVEANAPLGFSTAERVAMLRRPWSASRLVLSLPARWLTISRRAHRARRASRFDAVVVGYLGQLDVLLARMLFPRDTIVLDLLILGADTARDRGVSSGIRLRLLSGLDALAARCADVIMVDTLEQRALLSPASRSKAVVVPVGAAAAWFAAGDAHPSDDADAPLRVVFFGLFTPLQGAGVIGDALAELAGDAAIVTTMIGVGQDWARTRRAAAGNEHVTWLDWVQPEALPALVASHDVCLGIFGTGAKAQRVVPNKVYQGAAAKCAVVTSDTAPQRRALEEAAMFVPAGDPVALAHALRGLASDRGRLSELRRAGRRRVEQRFAAAALVDPLRPHLWARARGRQSEGAVS